MRRHIRNFHREIENGGWRGAVEFASRLTHRKLFTESGGTPIWDRSWDVVVILDACRHDLMTEVADEYEFLGSVDSFRSVGSHSKAWMEWTFAEEFRDEAQATAYVTANPFTDVVLSDDDCGRLEEVWRYGWDSELGAIPPRPVTDTAISVAREDDWGRLIVHYMQPHVPFLEYNSDGVTFAEFQDQGIERLGDDWNTALHRLQRGDLSRDEFWRQYRSNLRLVLDEVAILLENMDADTVVISADHGNALGERWLYGHPGGVDIPCLRTVPWVKTSATDEGTHTPAEYKRDTETDITEQLAALGYRASEEG